MSNNIESNRAKERLRNKLIDIRSLLKVNFYSGISQLEQLITELGRELEESKRRDKMYEQQMADHTKIVTNFVVQAFGVTVNELEKTVEEVGIGCEPTIKPASNIEEPLTVAFAVDTLKADYVKLVGKTINFYFAPYGGSKCRIESVENGVVKMEILDPEIASKIIESNHLQDWPID